MLILHSTLLMSPSAALLPLMLGEVGRTLEKFWDLPKIKLSWGLTFFECSGICFCVQVSYCYQGFKWQSLSFNSIANGINTYPIEFHFCGGQ